MEPAPAGRWKTRLNYRPDYEGNQALTEEDVRSYPLRPYIVDGLAAFQAETGKRPEEINVLDYGCGRGTLVGQLRARGFRAYGLDVEASYVEQGRAYFERILPGERPLDVMGANGRSAYPDAFFDVVLSEEVLEHVEDLAAAAAEIARVTRPGGVGIHLFPGKWKLVEPHLKLPIVHWLPKRPFTKPIYRGLIALGFGARSFERWEPRERTDVFYEFVERETYYRTNAEVAACFERQGMDCHLTGTSASNKVYLRTRRR